MISRLGLEPGLPLPADVPCVVVTDTTLPLASSVVVVTDPSAAVVLDVVVPVDDFAADAGAAGPAPLLEEAGGMTGVETPPTLLIAI